MPELSVLLLAACMFLGAVLYTSVGHAGASVYIALMALFGIAPAVMRPTALALNILVSAFTSFQFVNAGLFRWRTLWPFLIGAIPFAFLGGSVHLPGAYYRPLVGAVLLFSGARLLWPRELKSSVDPRDPPIWVGVLCGMAIGFLSGLTGTGGGTSFLRFCFSSDGLTRVPLLASPQSSSLPIRLLAFSATWPSCVPCHPICGFTQSALP